MKALNRIYEQQSVSSSDLPEDLEISLDELDTVVGGQMNKLFKSSNLMAGCTSGTRSVCHIDGTDDADAAF